MPAAARKDSDTVDCQYKGAGKFSTVTGESASVKIGGEWAVCVTDEYSCSGKLPPTASTPCKSGKVTEGSKTVVIDSKAVARKGDATLCIGTGGIGKIKTGDETVIVGDDEAGGGGGGGGAGTQAAASSSHVRTLATARKSGTPFCEVCEGVKKPPLGKSKAPPAKKQPPAKTQVKTCDLQTMTVKCAHAERPYILIVGKLDKSGRKQTVLEVLAGQEGDEIVVTTATDPLKPYCPNHLKKPIDVSPPSGAQSVPTPTSAVTTFVAKPTLDLGNRLRTNPFSFLWPQSISPRAHAITAPSCGGSLSAVVQCYADIRWSASIDIPLGKEKVLKPAKGKDNKVPAHAAKSRLRKTTGEAEIELTYGKVKTSLGQEFTSRIHELVKAARIATDAINWLGDKLGRYANTTITINPPNLSINGEWGLKELDDWRVGTELSVTAGFDPFIEICVSFDILAAILASASGGALLALKKLLDASIAEVGVYLSADGSIAGTVTAKRVLGSPRIDAEGEVSGEIVFRLEGKAEAEKKWLGFHVGGEAKIGGTTSLKGSLRSLADDQGFGVVGNLGISELMLYIEAGASAGFEIGTYDLKFGVDSPEDWHWTVWDGCDFVKDAKAYILHNASGGAATT